MRALEKCLHQACIVHSRDNSWIGPSIFLRHLRVQYRKEAKIQSKEETEEKTTLEERKHITQRCHYVCH